MIARGGRLLARADKAPLIAGLVGVATVLAVLLPWLRADPPAHLSSSNAPYTDEGLYNAAARNLVLFGSFGHLGLFGQLTNGVYAVTNAALFAVSGPSIAAARMLSVLSLCAMVLLALWGLSGVIGFPSALLVGAGLVGSQLLLLYGHVAIVEPFEAALLFAAFVAMTRAMASKRWTLGALSGLFLAAAVGAKASAFLAFPAVIGVPVAGSLLMRAWRRLLIPLAAVGAFLLLAGVWALSVALPNRTDLSTSFKTLNGTKLGTYPHSIGDALRRLNGWIRHPAVTDHVVPWNLPLLVAALAGTLCCVLLWRRCVPARLYVTVSGLLWVACAWAVPVLSAYDPNRYFVVGIPGLALASGPGLGAAVEWLTARLPAAGWRIAGAVAVALAVCVPGLVSYLRVESTVTGTHQLASDQVAVEGVLPRNAVVFGLYAPEMVFSDRVRTVVPWPASGLHMKEPVQRYGVNYVIVDIGKGGDWGDAAILRAASAPGHPPAAPLVTVVWGPHRLAVYRVAAAPPSPK